MPFIYYVALMQKKNISLAKYVKLKLKPNFLLLQNIYLSFSSTVHAQPLRMIQWPKGQEPNPALYHVLSIYHLSLDRWSDSHYKPAKSNLTPGGKAVLGCKVWLVGMHSHTKVPGCTCPVRHWGKVRVWSKQCWESCKFGISLFSRFLLLSQLTSGVWQPIRSHRSIKHVLLSCHHHTHTHTSMFSTSYLQDHLQHRDPGDFFPWYTLHSLALPFHIWKWKTLHNGVLSPKTHKCGSCFAHCNKTLKYMLFWVCVFFRLQENPLLFSISAEVSDFFLFPIAANTRWFSKLSV